MHNVYSIYQTRETTLYTQNATCWPHTFLPPFKTNSNNDDNNKAGKGEYRLDLYSYVFYLFSFPFC